MPNPAALARMIEAELRRATRPERAAAERRYLKSDLSFIGATLAEVRGAAKTVSRDAALDHDGVVALAEALWSKRVFERRMAAVIVLALHAEALAPEDLTLVEQLVRESGTWALVDPLATDVVGEIAWHHRIRRTLERWAKDHDFWVRRASLLAELKPLKRGAAFEPFARRADDMLEEAEFFIRKAIGWVLREMSKSRPAEVEAWIAPRTRRASGVTMREAVKYLEPRTAARLMQAYREKRPAG